MVSKDFLNVLKHFRKEKTPSFYRQKYDSDRGIVIHQLTTPLIDDDGRPYYFFKGRGKGLLVQGVLHEFEDDVEARKFNEELRLVVNKDEVYYKEKEVLEI